MCNVLIFANIVIKILHIVQNRLKEVNKKAFYELLMLLN